MLYLITSNKKVIDIAENELSWAFYIEATDLDDARYKAINEFIKHVNDYSIDFNDLNSMDEVNRELLFRDKANYDGLKPIYYGAIGEFKITEMSRGLNKLFLV